MNPNPDWQFAWQPLAANAVGWRSCGLRDGRVQLFSCGTSITLDRPAFDVLLSLLASAWSQLRDDPQTHGLLSRVDEHHYAQRCKDCGVITLGLKNQSVRMNLGGLQTMLALCRDTLLALDGGEIDEAIEIIKVVTPALVLHPPVLSSPSLN